MKRFFAASAGVLLLVAVGFFAFVNIDSRRTGKVIERCKTLRLGMTRAEVDRAMGPPSREIRLTPGRGVADGEADKLVTVYRTWAGADSAPTVTFNAKMGRVEEVSCTESHRRIAPQGALSNERRGRGNPGGGMP
ncbi:MAG: hypothetical protein ABII00_05580 [Elusimicrobiota bacterium]